MGKIVYEGIFGDLGCLFGDKTPGFIQDESKPHKVTIEEMETEELKIIEF
jgi:hypothetical protein